MKATLEFDLNDFDDRMAHMRCVKAMDMALALWEIQTRLRKDCEHRIDANQEMSDQEKESAHKVLDIVFDEITDTIYESNKIILDDLVV